MAHSQLTLAQRYKISAYLQAGITKSNIALYIDVHRSTVYREVKRNSVNNKYDPEEAHRRDMQRKHQRKPKRISEQAWHVVETLLKMDYSPEQISGLFNRTGVYRISHEWIYQYVLADKQAGGKLWKHLRWSHKKRRKRYGKQDRRGTIPNRVSIDQRPKVVERKSRIGDGEIDTVTGKKHKGILIVAVERKSKHAVIEWSPYKKADLGSNAIIKMLTPYREHVKTITVDNGKEFSFHQQIARALNAKVYFAHPYSAWERGLNENTIGLIRQYFPKNMSLQSVNSKQIAFAENRLNNRPRKTLHYRLPNEVLYKTVAFGT
jgi:IS30 family transposase